MSTELATSAQRQLLQDIFDNCSARHVLEYKQKIRGESVTDSGGLVTLRHDLRVGDAMQILFERDILGAPVIASEEEGIIPSSPHLPVLSKDYMGWLDMDFILDAFLESYDVAASQQSVKEAIAAAATAEGAESPSRAKLRKPGADALNDARIATFLDRTVTDMVLAPYSWIEDVLPITNIDVPILHFIKHGMLRAPPDNAPATYPFSGAYQVAASREGAHRLLVCNPEKELLDTISQTDVVRFLHHKMEHDADLLRMISNSVSHFKLGKELGHLEKVPDSMLVIEALGHMRSTGCSALAVVKEYTKELVGSWSGNSLKGLQPSAFADMALPLSEFSKRQNPVGNSPVDVDTVATFTCRPWSSLKDVLQLLSQGEHRVWIVNDMNQPVGVISLTDVITLLPRLTLIACN